MFSFSRLGRSSGCSSGLIVCIVYLRNSLLPSFCRTNSCAASLHVFGKSAQMADFVMRRRDFQALRPQGVLYLDRQRLIEGFPILADSVFLSTFALREDGSRIVRADRAPEIEPSSTQGAFQRAIPVIGRIAEAVAQVMKIHGELCALLRVMREQFLQIGIVDCIGSEPETFLPVLKSLNEIS